jgi:hypothetical protein
MIRVTLVFPPVPTSEAIPTGSVILVEVEIKIFAQKKSFQEAMKSTTASADIAGLLKGRIIWKKILNGPAPSIFADSSSSFGIDLKN